MNLNSIENNTYYTKLKSGWFIDSEKLINSYYKNYNIIPGSYYSNSKYFRRENEKIDQDPFSKSLKRKKIKEHGELKSYEKFIVQFFENLNKEINFKQFQRTHCENKKDKTDLITWTNLSLSGYGQESADISDIENENDLYYFNRLITNNSDEEKSIQLLNTSYIVPPYSSFILGDFKNIENLVTFETQNQFDIIIIDPPWENISAQRSKSYSFIDHRKLSKIPIPKLINKESSSLVVVWVTNRKNFKRYIKNTLFTQWGIQYMTTWYWLKVTNNGEMVIDIHSTHRKPYETLIIGCYNKENQIKDIIPQVICSIPSQHSRKPPLKDILQNYLPEKEKFNCLDLFSRSLSKETCSWGNESILFQEIGKYMESKSQ